MEWFLINVLSPLLLPVFLILVLGLICDAKPDPFIKIYLDMVQTVLAAALKVLVSLLKMLGQFSMRCLNCFFQFLGCVANGCSEKCSCPEKKPAPSPRKRTEPKSSGKSPFQRLQVKRHNPRRPDVGGWKRDE